MYRRVDQLDEISGTVGREVKDLHEQVRALKVELSAAKEEKDFAVAQLASMKEQESLLEEEKSVLKAQLDSSEEEKSRVAAAKDKLEEEHRALQLINQGLREEIRKANSRIRTEEELRTKFLNDCHDAVEARGRAENRLRELQSSIKEERIEAIKRWKERHLIDECVEFACDLTLTLLRNAHRVCVPDGADGPLFEDYAEPLLPPELGLSLDEIKEMVEKEKEVLPDEMLDLSSDEEEEPSQGGISSVPPAGPDPTSAALPASSPGDRDPAASSSPSPGF